jgi:CRP/FNR family transcriptional regulator, anaerobic regulatory protein
MTEKPIEMPPPVACRNCRLGRLTIYGATVAATPDIVSTHRREVRTFPAGRTFLREGETQSLIFTLYSGWAFSFVTLADGRRQIFSFFVPGDTLVLDSLAMGSVRLPFSIKSLTDVTLCALEAAAVDRLVRTGKAQQTQAAEAMGRYLAATYGRLANIGRRSALGRMAQLIIELEARLDARQMSERGTVPFPLRQEHLADALGLTKVYVNRTLDRLRRMQTIAFDRHSLTILNRKLLSEIAQEE